MPLAAPPFISRRKRRGDNLLKRLALTGLILGTASALTVQFGGQNIGTTVTVNGQTYISIDTLRAAGLTVTLQDSTVTLALPGSTGGQNQVNATQGCLNQQLFNGVWRLKVSDMTQRPSDNKRVATIYDFNVETRNGTPGAQNWHGTGYISEGVTTFYLAFPNDVTVRGKTGSLDHLYHKVLPAGALNVKLTFEVPQELAGQTPTKLLWLREGNMVGSERLPWNTKDHNFRIDLNCQQ